MFFYDEIKALLVTAIKQRVLILEMARRELQDRYSGQMLGTVWAVAHPIFLMGLFVFVFSVVFKQRIGGTYDLPLDYTAYILSGLVCWLSLQDSLNKSCTAISSNSTLVNQVIFPIEVLILKSAVVSLIPLLVSLTVLVFYVLFSNLYLPISYLFIPLLVIFQFIFMVGLGFILAPLGAYFKDLKDLVQVFTQLNMYLMPVVYLPGWVPSIFKPIMYLNPFSYLVWCYQDVLYFGRIEHPVAWVVTIILVLSTTLFGVVFFQKIKHGLGAAL